MPPSTVGSLVSLEQMHADPYPIFERMQAEEPISWVPAFNLWMVTRRDDVMAILRDADTYTMEPEGGQINPMEDTLGKMMLSIDGEEHKRVRDAFIEPYRPRHVRAFYESLIQSITDRILEDLLPLGTADLDKAFSDPLATYTVVATLGFEVNDLSRFRDWYDEFAVAIGNVKMDETLRARGKRAFKQFEAMVLAQIEHLKAHPNHSVLSQLIHNQEVDLTQAELVSNVALTFFGGIETTSAMLSNTIWALLKNPDQLQMVREDPGRLANALEESLRWESPVQAAMRFPVHDVEIHGVSIPKHSKIYCMLGAANRDRAVFEQPELFDATRPNADKHLAFAYGPHFCFGAPLARREALIGIASLIAKLPNLRIDPDRPTKPVGHEFRSTPTLYALWNTE